MGLVLLARDSTLDRDVAVKLIRRDLLEDQSDAEQIVARFQREARIGARFASSGLARVYDAGFDETTGDAYIVMELVQGTSLAKTMKSPRRPTDQWIACLMTHLCITVRELHRFSIIHRDIKPSNVTLCVDGRAVLLDLGLARDLGTTGPGITKGKQVLGTPAYMSPEQIKGAPVSVRTDVYALGVLLHELVSGTRPFVGEQIYLLYAHVYEEPPLLQALRPEADAQLCGLAAAMLAKRADSRPSMEEVLDRLAELLPPSGFGHVEAPDFPPLIEPVRPLVPKAVSIGTPQTAMSGNGVAGRVRAADALYDAGRALEAFAQYEVLALELAHELDQFALHCRIRAAQCLAARGEHEVALQRFRNVQKALQPERSDSDSVVLEVRRHVALQLLAVERLDEAAVELSRLYSDLLRIHGSGAAAAAEVRDALITLWRRLRGRRIG
jgi:hypothetical protein